MMRDHEYQQELREREARQERLDKIVRAATASVAGAIASTPPPLHTRMFYGYSAIDPRLLVTWFIFRTDAEYADAQASGLTARIDKLTREELLRRGYPAEAVPEIHVGFTTDETIQREAGGNYRQYFS